MSVRRAKYPADANAIKALVREAWTMTSYGHLEINEGMLTRAVHEYNTHQKSRVWVSEDKDGSLTGMLAASIGQLQISQALGATDSVFYCKSGEGQALINRYVKWAKKEGASVIGMCVSSGRKRADRLIEASGFTRAGGNFYLIGGDDE